MKHGLQVKAVQILGMAMTTGVTRTFSEKSSLKLAGYDLTEEARAAWLR